MIRDGEEKLALAVYATRAARTRPTYLMFSLVPSRDFARADRRSLRLSAETGARANSPRRSSFLRHVLWRTLAGVMRCAH
jgi:hypothetical protein